jgi:hypothetical protein
MPQLTHNPQLICVIIHFNANKRSRSKSENKDVYCSSIVKANNVYTMISEQLCFGNIFTEEGIS